MSPKRDRTVRQIVEKYRCQYPILERPLLRKLIRLEHRDVFKPESGPLKTLDRELKRSYKIEPFTLLQTSTKLVKERLVILGAQSNPELIDFQNDFQLSFDTMVRLAQKKLSKQPPDTKQIIEDAKRETLALFEAHREIKEVTGESAKK